MPAGTLKATRWEISGVASSDPPEDGVVLTPLYVKTAAQEASLSCWRVRKSLMTR